MKKLLLPLSLTLATLPLLVSNSGFAADDLPPPRADATQVQDDLPPSTARPKTAARGFQPSLKYGADDLLLETGALPDAPEADIYSTLRASAFVLWQPSRNWELRAGARLDAMSQDGGSADHRETLGDYTDTYVRYRNGDSRLTLGAQTIIWGRADEIPLADRVSRVDLTRFVLDDLPERRRAQLAARWEQGFGDFKLDAVWLPLFRGAQMPDIASVWSPINRTTGQVLGFAPSPTLAAVVRNASIDEDEHGSGGGAVRLTRTGAPFDYGITLARTRQSQPYYQFGGTPLAPTLTAVHPFNTFAGADMELVSGALTWRMEIGYTDDVPATLGNGTMISTESLDWIGALEFFPGGKDTRINLQLVAHALQSDASILELKEYYGVNGEIETRFAQDRWIAGMRFALGINVEDVYLNPRLSFVGWEPHEIYFDVHYFDGEDQTMGGFHQDHGMIALGLRSTF